MNSKSSIVLGVLLALVIIGSVSAIFYRTFIAKDYLITAQISCDPATESCFVIKCDPAIETCDGTEEVVYYKLLSRNAKQALSCKNDDGTTCIATACAPGEAGCEITTCDPAEADAMCSGSEQQNSASEKVNTLD